MEGRLQDRGEELAAVVRERFVCCWDRVLVIAQLKVLPGKGQMCICPHKNLVYSA